VCVRACVRACVRVCAYDKKRVCVDACVCVCACDKKSERQDKKREREREATATGGVAEEWEKENEADGLEREEVGMACADVDARGATTQQPAFYCTTICLLLLVRYFST
jgi:hypothetical protein